MKIRKYWKELLIFIIYFILCLIIINRHEIWYDEAQSWLLSKTLSFGEIIKQMDYEGHSCLYYFILRCLYLMGFKYTIISYLSLLFCSIGVLLILFKMDIKLLYKIVMIFNPAVLYYCSCFGRPYALFFLMMVIVTLLYKDRLKHSLGFGISMMLLGNTHLMASGFIFALFLIELYEYIKKKDYKLDRIIIMLLEILGEYIFLLQIIGCLGARSDLVGNRSSFLVVLMCLFGDFKHYEISLLLSFILFFISFILLFFENKKMFFISFINFVIAYLFLYYSDAHSNCKMVFIFIPLIFLLFYNKKQKADLFIVLFLINSFLYSYDYIKYDLFNDFSQSKKLASIIKEETDKDSEKINIFTFNTTFPEVLMYLDDSKYVFYNCNGSYEFESYVWVDDCIFEKEDLEYYINKYDIDFTIDKYASYNKKYLNELGADKLSGDDSFNFDIFLYKVNDIDNENGSN